jgi:tetratricopeptide (TPR) repeat protein
VDKDEVTVELSATARAASEAFRSGNYEEASRLYFEALKEASGSSGKNSPEAVGCLQGLADSYYAQAKFIESKSVYMQLVQMQSNDKVAGRIAPLFKLAMSHENLQEYDDAERLFNEALDLSDKTLAPGDPQVTSILESFADMMRKARRDPRRLAELEERARASRHSSDPAAKTMEQVSGQEKPLETKYVWEPKKQLERDPRDQLFSGPSQRTSGILAAAREHPRLMMSCLCVPFSIGGLVLEIMLISTII